MPHHPRSRRTIRRTRSAGGSSRVPRAEPRRKGRPWARQSGSDPFRHDGRGGGALDRRPSGRRPGRRPEAPCRKRHRSHARRGRGERPKRALRRSRLTATRAGALGWSEGARLACRAAGRCRADLQGAVPPEPVWPTKADAAPSGRLAVRGASARPPDRCGAPRRRFGRGRGARRRSKCSSPFEHRKCTLRFPPSATGKADELGGEPPTSSP